MRIYVIRATTDKELADLMNEWLGELEPDLRHFNGWPMSVNPVLPEGLSEETMAWWVDVYQKHSELMEDIGEETASDFFTEQVTNAAVWWLFTQHGWHQPEQVG